MQLSGELWAGANARWQLLYVEWDGGRNSSEKLTQALEDDHECCKGPSAMKGGTHVPPFWRFLGQGRPGPGRVGRSNRLTDSWGPPRPAVCSKSSRVSNITQCFWQVAATVNGKKVKVHTSATAKNSSEKLMQAPEDDHECCSGPSTMKGGNHAKILR